MAEMENEFEFSLDQWSSMPLLTESFAAEVDLDGLMSSRPDPYEDCVLWLFPEPGIAFMSFWMGADETPVATFNETTLVRAFLLGVPYSVHHNPSVFQMDAVNNFLGEQWREGTDPELQIVDFKLTPDTAAE